MVASTLGSSRSRFALQIPIFLSVLVIHIGSRYGPSFQGCRSVGIHINFEFLRGNFLLASICQFDMLYVQPSTRSSMRSTRNLCVGWLSRSGLCWVFFQLRPLLRSVSGQSFELWLSFDVGLVAVSSVGSLCMLKIVLVRLVLRPLAGKLVRWLVRLHLLGFSVLLGLPFDLLL
ncbi:hypothetical protein L208DRAFT_1550124 [Tricholoma matsutake]|nr:hypothetical protein L208DRAFT_1550124 [Tricholoma matsutake 945]